jgi:hypothetical protein
MAWYFKDLLLQELPSLLLENISENNRLET